MESLDSLPDISHVPVDLVPRVDAFPQGPPTPPHPRLLRAENAGAPCIRSNLGGKGNGKLPLPCMPHPSRPFSLQQVSKDAQTATVKRGPGRPRKNPKPDSPFSLPGHLCQLQQQQPPLQLLQQHGQQVAYGNCSEDSESQAALFFAPQLFEPGSLHESGVQMLHPLMGNPALQGSSTRAVLKSHQQPKVKQLRASTNNLVSRSAAAEKCQVSNSHPFETSSLPFDKRKGESYEGCAKHCQSNVCNSQSFKALLPADMNNAPLRTLASILPSTGKEVSREQASIIDPKPIPPANEIVHPMAQQVGRNTENVNIRMDFISQLQNELCCSYHFSETSEEGATEPISRHLPGCSSQGLISLPGVAVRCCPTEESGPCTQARVQHRFEEGQALPSQANALGISLHNDAMLDPPFNQDPSFWVRLEPNNEISQGIHNATEAGSEIMDREAFGDFIDILAKESLQAFAEDLPPEIDNLALPPQPLLHGASQCHFDQHGLHCSDFLVKGAEMVDAVAIIQSPRQTKAKDIRSSRSPGASCVLDSQWACGSSSSPVDNEEKRTGECTRENMKAHVVESCEGTYTLRAHSQPCMDGCGADQSCSGHQSVYPSDVQPTLLALPSLGKKSSAEYGDAQQVETDEFHQFLSGLIRSPSPSPFLQRQMDFPMDLPTLEHTLNASPSKHETSVSSESAGMQVIHRAPTLEAQTPCFGLRLIGAEPMLPSHPTSREDKFLPHAPSCGPASGEIEQALDAHACGGFPANSQAGCPEGKAEDVLTPQECLPQMQDTSMLPEALPSFVGPSFYLASRCLDSNLAKIVSHENHCKGHTMEAPLAAAPGREWDMKAFTGVGVDKVIDNHCSTEPLESSFTSAEEDETGDRSKSAHGTYQESRRLRPAVADGEERVLTKDALQSVYHLPINEAAAQLQVGVTVLKKFCRQHNVGRWPYRKLLSVDKLVRSVEEQSEQNPAGANYIIRELGLLKQEIYNDPEVQLDGKIKKLRQSNFKMQYKQRVYAGKHAMSPGVLQKLGKGCKQDT
ncbi:hypothetical protein DUNSADRAFT_18384 [Dunaliella salina]|uniref:RWP-RK domain-containing protein n=1 Tax=Dunaliella salina TaxID=3046 RepID=A0ABQ7G060_DUNSA|nr:hypothetical protein DUNSADRAFT_18384 [Dunaliella salina]|eukprot:KAF5827988.1 hypothetical protein DUNSADRAFT_18384 [Dunaliella salina]